jgi:hypothetical protein
MEREEVLRQELVALLGGSNAHLTFEEVIGDFPLARINDKAPHMPYSPWHILEHMRRVQRDILAFIKDPDYVSPPWPQGYFPPPADRLDEAGWQRIVRGFLADRAELEAMARDRTIDLLAPIAHAKDYTVFRELMLAADHNAYHTGELAFMRQVMESWPPGKALYDARG